MGTLSCPEILGETVLTQLSLIPYIQGLPTIVITTKIYNCNDVFTYNKCINYVTDIFA